jgi:hypothetical protein
VTDLEKGEGGTKHHPPTPGFCYSLLKKATHLFYRITVRRVRRPLHVDDGFLLQVLLDDPGAMWRDISIHYDEVIAGSAYVRSDVDIKDLISVQLRKKKSSFHRNGMVVTDIKNVPFCFAFTFYHIYSLISMWYHSCKICLISHCLFLCHEVQKIKYAKLVCWL